MTCPICSLYFQDIEQEAFRHHALLSHDSAVMMQALDTRDSSGSRRAESPVTDTRPRGPKTEE
jgi:hypothetical protein